MSERYAAVITTINILSKAVAKLAACAGKLNSNFALFGDLNSHFEFYQQGAI